MSKKQTTEESMPTADLRDEYPRFTRAMKGTYKLLVPNMLPVHFGIILDILRDDGWDVELLTNDARTVIDEGLKHVHNDTCFPALCVTGQFIDALKSGKYDPDHTALLITQSGGGCRASNYIPLIRKALRAEFPQVPVASLNFAGLEKDSGFPLDLKTIVKLAYAVFYGDALMALYNQCKPYEREAGAADAARDACVAAIGRAYKEGKYRRYKQTVNGMVARFAAVPRSREEKVKVGIVGEIYVKYSPLGNSRLEEFLLAEGCEPVVPGLMDYVMYCAVNNVNDAKFYAKNRRSAFAFGLAYRYLHHMQRKINRLLARGGFAPLHDFEHLRRCADKVLNQGVKMGEGWLIPAEMAALAETGTENIVCAQPFGCLPNHIAGKGAIRTLKRLYEHENIVAVDYDPSATKVNQENRIKLMLATARENKQEKGAAEWQGGGTGARR